MEKSELIGKRMTITNARHKGLVGLSGIVLFETKNTIIIKTHQNKKTILKNGTEFEINGKRILGKNICKRPEERIKG